MQQDSRRTLEHYKWLVGQLSQCQSVLLGQAMIGRQSHHQFHFSHRFELDGRIQFDDRQGNESHVNPPIHQSRDLFLRQQIQDGQVHDGEAFAKRPDGRRQEQAANRRKNGDAQLARFATARRLRKLRSALNMRKNLPRLPQERFSSGRQGQLLLAPVNSFVPSSSSKS